MLDSQTYSYCTQNFMRNDQGVSEFHFSYVLCDNFKY